MSYNNYPQVNWGSNKNILKSDFIASVPWYIAPTLVALRKQINELAPNRNKSSDGGIGDENHQSRSSDHNPHVYNKHTKKYVVTAIDITHDTKNCSAENIAEALILSKDTRIKYIIWNKQICSSVQNPWVWRKYGGKNPHTKHIHISVRPEEIYYEDEGVWDVKV